MLIPNAERALIDDRKLADYCLDLTHPVDRHKAVVFRRALGFAEQDANILRELLLRAVMAREASVGRSDEHGQRYTVDFPVTTAIGSATVRSVWIIRAKEDFRRLATCYVLTG